MNHTLHETAVSNQSVATDLQSSRITLTAEHGLVAGSELLIKGTTNYNGMAYVNATPAAATLDVRRKYVAETPDDTYARIAAGITYPEKFEFLGFSLHLSAVGANTEDLEIAVDAAKGSAWDFKIYDEDMNGTQDIVWMPEEKVVLAANDLVLFSWANAGNKTWGLTIYSRALAL
jgi:hypothetical protein